LPLLYGPTSATERGLLPFCVPDMRAPSHELLRS
jgi:hypothetical protein